MPIGTRVIETPEDAVEARLRNPQVRLYRIRPGWQHQARGSAGQHRRQREDDTLRGLPWPDLKGLGPVPNLAGRSPSYLARQMYDMKLGTRKGAMSALMMPVLANLTDADIVDLMAYVSSLEP